MPPPRRSEEVVSVNSGRTRYNRSFSSSSSGQYPPRGASYGALGPGSFSSNLKNTNIIRAGTPKQEIPNPWNAPATRDGDGQGSSEYRQAMFLDKIAKETKIRKGTENMLEVLLTKNSKQTKEQRLRVETELSSSNRKIAALRAELEEEMQRSHSPSTPPRPAPSDSYRGSPLRSPSRANVDIEGTQAEGGEDFESESPTYVLTETLQELEVEGMPPDYYIERANKLVELFKRHPTLKYDLAWAVFGPRMQMLLMSDRTEVVAAGYRLTRYAIADRASIQRIRSHHTDELVILSLVKKGKAILEREQALKFVRAFLDVKDGVLEIPNAIIRTLVSISEYHDDRLRHMCTLTLTEILAKDPSAVVEAGGLGTLTDILSEGTFPASEGLVASLLHIFDTPSSRKCLKSGRELESVFAPFTDPLLSGGQEDKLKTCAKAIAAMLKTWPGFLTLSMNRAISLRSLLESLKYPSIEAKDLILELLFDVLRIKQPPIFTTFLAGRRLTTYGRVASIRDEEVRETTIESDYGTDRYDLTAHFTALVLAVFLDVGLVPTLVSLVEIEDDQAIKRKATLLLTEVLKLADRSLPSLMSVHLQMLPGLQSKYSVHGSDRIRSNSGMIFLIDSINRTLNRFEVTQKSPAKNASTDGFTATSRKSKLPPVVDEETFRKAMMDTGILTGREWALWKWDLIQDIIEGPLTDPIRFNEAVKFGKFMKRLVGFYRPFKGKFSKCYNNKSSQRYIKAGCALMKSLAKTNEGAKYLIDDKLMRQMAECLAQVDRFSGITSSAPIFSRSAMASTVSGGYFQMLGALSTEPRGIVMMERWHMMNMFYHIIELQDRPDLIQVLLTNLDYSSESHLRVLLSRALTAGAKDTRILATRLLRKYIITTRQAAYGRANTKDTQWVLKLLLTQLYDPEIQVGETAVRILEEACNRREDLEFVVKCRPALDHLGEIGAPLLLRFLSTSIGYHYLDNLDYITQEMDDWFLGRNDTYVTLVEASISRAYIGQFTKTQMGTEDLLPLEDLGVVPPHFYRELARTSEGCRLLRQSGHFYEFASSVQDFDITEEEPETLVKIKGCLWAIGNVGSMELGAPFLEESEVVSSIIRIAEHAHVLSLRGTACFVLGLISRSAHGLEMILEQGWDTASNLQGESLGLCMPRDLSKLFKIEFKTAQLDLKAQAKTIRKFKAARSDPDPMHAKILKSMIDLGNAVLSKRAATELHGARAKKPECFQNVDLFRRTLTILESHHFSLPARQFALDLFDKEVLRSVVLDEESDDSDDG